MEYDDNFLNKEENAYFRMKDREIYFNNTADAVSVKYSPSEEDDNNFSFIKTAENSYEMWDQLKIEWDNTNFIKLENVPVKYEENSPEVKYGIGNPDIKGKNLIEKEGQALSGKKEDEKDIIWNNVPLESEIRCKYVGKVEYVNLNIKKEDLSINCESSQDAASLTPETCDQWTPMLYLCNLCDFKTKYAYSLKSHIIRHKNTSETAMYRCLQCNYVTKHKHMLKRHTLRHKGPPEINNFKCNICTFEGKDKVYLERHMLTHKDPVELKKYQCEKCTYTTKHRYMLKRHAVTHQRASEVIMFKCKQCSFESKYKDSVRKHMKIHKS